MTLSRKTVLLVIIVVVFLSIVFRYPLVEHERNQADSFYIHRLSQAIVVDSEALWTFHPLSYFGYYPVSYPSGAPFLIAELSILSGSGIESCIWFYGVVIGIMYAVTAFCIAREFLKRPEYALAAAFLVVAGSRFVDTTYWVASARGLEVALIAITLFAFFRAAISGKRLLILIGVLCAFACFATHHMAVSLLLFAAAYLLSVIAGSFSMRLSDRKHPLGAGFILGLVAVGLLLTSVFWLESYSTSIISTYSRDYIFDLDPELLSVVLNMVASYTNQVGLIMPFSLLAVPFIIRSHSRFPRILYPVCLVIAFIPMLGGGLYVSMLIAPFMCIVGVQWLFRQCRVPRCRRWALAITTFVLAGSLILPVWSTNAWNEDEYFEGFAVDLDPAVFNDAVYLKNVAPDGYGLSNSGALALHISAISGVNYIGSGPFMALTGDTTHQQISDNLTWSESVFPSNMLDLLRYPQENYPFLVQIYLVHRGMDFIFATGPISEYARTLFRTHPNVILTVDNDWPSSVVAPWYVEESILLQQVAETSWNPVGYDSTITYSLPCYVFYRAEESSSYLLEVMH